MLCISDFFFFCIYFLIHVINEICSIISLEKERYESFFQIFHFCISNELLFCVLVCLLVLDIILSYWEISSKCRSFLVTLLYLIFPKRFVGNSAYMMLSMTEFIEMKATRFLGRTPDYQVLSLHDSFFLRQNLSQNLIRKIMLVNSKDLER